MKNTALAATLIWFLAAPLIASGQAPTPVKPVAPAAASPRPAAAGHKPVKQKKKARRVRHKAGPRADARACLELATNAQIIKCAEKYR